MPKAGIKRLVVALFAFALVSMVFLTSPWLKPHIIACAEELANLKNLPAEFIPEEGSPLAVETIKSELELDPVGAPRANRLFIDYRNVSDRAIAGVKFRVRYADDFGKDRGTYHAPHGSLVPPGGHSAEKWRHERVDPRTTQLKVRALQVRFADGSSWQSKKAGPIAMPGGQSAFVGTPAPAADGSSTAAGQDDSNSQAPTEGGGAAKTPDPADAFAGQ